MTGVELMRLVDKDREARGLSRAAYARYIGIDKSAYTRYLSGERSLSNDFLEKLAHKVPALYPDICAYQESLVAGLLDQWRPSVSSEVALRDARNGLNHAGEGKTSE